MTAQTQHSHLNPAQHEVVERGLLDSGFNSILQLPTGSGKTWLAERAMEQVLNRGGRVIYLTPLRALAAELTDRWSAAFGPDKVGVFTGEYGVRKPYPLAFGDARLLVMTPERLDACTRHWRTHWHWMPEVDLVVVDEFHLIGDPGRGPRLEGALGRLRRLNPFAQVVGLSATMGNVAELSDWLGGVCYQSEWRSMPLEWKLLRFRKATDKPRLMVDTVQSCIDGGGQSLVFVQSRRRAEQLSAHLREAGLVAAHHHAGLESEERQRVEARYRARQTDVLISTGTLEMGVNLPARQVLLYDLQRFNGLDFVPLSVNTVWQRAGRAGRRGLDDRGQVVLLAPTWDRQAERYLDGTFEPIRSGLNAPQALAEQILAEVASGLSRNLCQLKRALSQTLAQHQNRLEGVESVVGEMLSSGMLEDVDDVERRRTSLRATRLGRIAVRQMLSPATVVHLARALKTEEAEYYTFLDLLLLAAASTDCEPRVPADFEELDTLVDVLGHERSYLLGRGSDDLNARMGCHGRRLLNVIKTALVARQWTRVGDAEAVAEDFGCYPFELRRLTESLVRILTACVAIMTPPKSETEIEEPVPLLADEPTLAERVRALLAMVSYGIDEEAVTLTFLNGVGGTLARHLQAHGIGDIEALAESEAEELNDVRGVSLRRAEAWIAQAVDTIGTRSALALRETGARIQPLSSDWPEQVDPYRLRRAQELSVRSRGSRRYGVTGGLEPHRVSLPPEGAPRCDCADFAKGNVCKHILAVRLYRGDRSLKHLVERMGNAPSNLEGLDLFQLWFQRRAA